MKRRIVLMAWLTVLIGVLASACGKPEKILPVLDDLNQKTQNAKCREDVRVAIGEPSNVNKQGKNESWTYFCKEDKVILFEFEGDQLQTVLTGFKEGNEVKTGLMVPGGTFRLVQPTSDK